MLIGCPQLTHLQVQHLPGCADFPTNIAVALSNITIVGGSISNFVLNVGKRHHFMDRPLIDWDLIIVMEPATILGALVGGYLNRASGPYQTSSFCSGLSLARCKCMPCASDLGGLSCDPVCRVRIPASLTSCHVLACGSQHRVTMSGRNPVAITALWSLFSLSARKAERAACRLCLKLAVSVWWYFLQRV